MTCQECQPLAIDLARGLPPFDVGGAVQRGDVLSHIARCKRCAQWVAEQEALTVALRAAAEADASLSAPLSVEANVMAAWRARQAQRRPKPAWPAWPAWAAWPAWPTSASAFAAAAVVILLALTVASLGLLNAPPAANAVTNNAGDASTSSPPAAVHPGERSGDSTRARVTGTHAAVVEVLPEKRTKGTKGRNPPRRGMLRQANAARGTNSALGTHAALGPNTARGASDFSGPAFVLLPYVEPLRPTEMRHIMRVRMSRTQLVAGEIQAGGVDGATVLADVLVGEDGTARAVRIVQ